MDISCINKPARPHKGISLLKSFDEYVAIDIETTGLDTKWDSVIEMAAVHIKEGVIVESFQSLVNPGFEIDEFITSFTGITNEMVSSAPPMVDVLPKFLAFVGNSIVVGHNANFDINFIYDNCTMQLNAAFENSFVDTMRLSRRLFKEHDHHRLRDLVRRFGISGNIEHRSLSDAIKTYECYEYMKKYATDNGIEFASLYPRRHRQKLPLRAKDMQTINVEFNEDSPIFGKQFVFTGVLEKMIRKDAMQIVVDIGGTCGDNVTKTTDYLVLGNNDYCASIKGGKSNKQKKAEKLKLSGQNIEVISENVFYDMLNDGND